VPGADTVREHAMTRAERILELIEYRALDVHEQVQRQLTPKHRAKGEADDRSHVA